MHPFLHKILAATQLTRAGKVAEATAAIQRALMPATQAGAHIYDASPGDVIEATVVEVAPETRPALPAPSPIRAATALDEAAVPTPAPTALDDAAATLPELMVIDEAAPVEDVPAPARARTGHGRFRESSFTGAAGTRTFKLFVPDGFESQALPLLVMLHGCTQDPDDFAAGTRMNALAQEQGFLVLYPAQAPRSNAHKCWNWFSPGDQRRGAGEPALLAGMTRHILQTHRVDPDRVYVAGLSAGGAMAAILAREYPDLFAAGGVHSGVAPGSARDVASAFAVMQAGPGAASELALAFATLRSGAAAASSTGPHVPLIVFHGDADKTVVPANGHALVDASLGGVGPVIATISASPRASGARSFERTVWHRDGGPLDAPSLAERWVVHGSPHAWSGGAESGSYTDPAGPDASREMLRFFREHPRSSP